MPIRCVSSNDYMLVLERKREMAFHMMDKGFELVSGFGQMGEGPDEWKERPLLWHHDFARLNGVHYYFFGESKICKVGLDENGKFIGDSETCYELPSELYNVQKVFAVTNNMMVGNGGMSEGKLYFFNPYENTEVTITEFYPKAEGNVNEEFKRYNYMGYLAYSKKHEKIVFANTYFDQIELYDLKGGIIREIRGNTGFKDDLVGKGGENFYYHSVLMTDNYIYALYLGENKKSIVKSMLNLLKSKIRIFDINGEPVAELKLDRLVDDFFLNEKENNIYCLSGEEEEKVFVKYELPDLF